METEGASFVGIRHSLCSGTLLRVLRLAGGQDEEGEDFRRGRHRTKRGLMAEPLMDHDKGLEDTCHCLSSNVQFLLFKVQRVEKE